MGTSAKRRPTVFRDEFYEGQLGRTLATAGVGLADLGEAVSTARSIGDPSPDRWFAAWFARAESTCRVAESTSDAVGARSAYLRASEYYRQAYFFLRHDPTDERLLEAYGKHVATFRKAAAQLDVHVEQIAIPFGDASLSGYLFAPDDSGRARPTVLFPCGYDSTAEEGYQYVPAALDRGYNAVTFEGPGQGGALYVQKLVFRPDFEVVVTPLVDLLTARSDVDAAALLLVGHSFAGYLAPRAAAFEPRLAGLVVDQGQPNMGTRVPQGIAGRIAPHVVALQMRRSAGRREFFGSRMAAHGVATVSEYFADLRRYDLTGVAGRISCPTLVVECDGDPIGGGGPELMRMLRAPASLVTLTEAQGAAGHCGGLGQRVLEGVVFDWAAGVLPTAST